MTAVDPHRRGARQRRMLQQLFQQQGLQEGEYAYFFVTGEGTFLPISTPDDEVEETSGFVIDRQGRIFFFWCNRSRPLGPRLHL